MLTKINLTSISAGLIVPTMAAGHPGHGVEPHTSLLHYISEPVHWALGFLLILVCLASIKAVRFLFATDDN